MLNPAPASKELLLSDPVFSCVDFLLPNETESQLLTQKSSENEDELMDGLLSERKGMIVIMTLGGNGAYIGMKGEVLQWRESEV